MSDNPATPQPSLFLVWIGVDNEDVTDKDQAEAILRDFAGVNLIVQSLRTERFADGEYGLWLAELHPDWQQTLLEVGWFGLEGYDHHGRSVYVEAELPTGTSMRLHTRPLSMRNAT